MNRDKGVAEPYTKMAEPNAPRRKKKEASWSVVAAVSVVRDVGVDRLPGHALLEPDLAGGREALGVIEHSVL